MKLTYSVVKEAATSVNLYDSGQVDFALINMESLLINIEIRKMSLEHIHK